MAGECEIKNVQAMKIMDLFAAGGSFREFYLADFKDDVVFLGHDGPGALCDCRRTRGLGAAARVSRQAGQGTFHPDDGQPRPGDAVVGGTRGRRKGLFADGRRRSGAGPILQIGNTNSRYRFSIGAKAFINEWSQSGPAHHCAIGVGHIADKIEKLGALLDLEVRRVC